MTENRIGEIDEPIDPSEHTPYENLQDAIQGVDEPMEDSHPASTGFMVYGAYPLLLLIFLIAAFAIAGLRNFLS